MNELVRRGKLNREQIESSPYKQYKNAVTRAVGVYGSVEVDTFDFDILPGDRFLICSDGMYAYVDEDELPKQLADGEVKDVPKKLVDVANAGGGHDNITAVVIRVGERPRRPSSRRATPRSRSSSRSSRACRCSATCPTRSWCGSRAIAEIVELKAEQIDLQRGPARRRDVRRARRARVRLTKGETTVAELGRGQHFGEMALVDRSVRSLTATATEAHAARRRSTARTSTSIIKREPASAVKMLWASSRCSARACARPRTISATRCTATGTATRPRQRTCSRTRDGVRLVKCAGHARARITRPYLGTVEDLTTDGLSVFRRIALQRMPHAPPRRRPVRALCRSPSRRGTRGATRPSLHRSPRGQSHVPPRKAADRYPGSQETSRRRARLRR